jgi:TonB family protein
MIKFSQFSMMFAILAISTATPAYAAKDPINLEPSSKWHVNYLEDSCRLMRVFGEGDESVHLVIDKFAPGKTIHMVLAGNGLASERAWTRNGELEIEIQFGQNELVQKWSFMTGDFADRPALIVSGGDLDGPLKHLDDDKRHEKESDPSKYLPLSPERADAIHYIRLGKPLGQEVNLKTGSLKAPFAALDQCIDELLTHWGIDVERHHKLSRAAAPANSPGRWVTFNDYPTHAISRGMQGLVHFRLNIDNKGNVTACHIQQSTRPVEFDVAVCNALTKRAEFEPALDDDGQPIASFWRSAVRFVIP